MTATTERRLERLGAWPAVVTVAVLFGGAVVGIVRTATRPPLGASATTDVWSRVLGDDRFWAAAGFTLGLALASTVLSVAVAVPLAALVRRSPLARVAISVPIVVPHLLVAVVTVLWLGPGGLAERVLGELPLLVRDPLGAGIVLVYLVKEVPFLTVLILAAWTSDVDQRAEVAATLGVPPGHRLRRVVWPAVRAPVVLGSTVVAAFVLGSLQVPETVGPTGRPTVPQYALQAVRLDGLSGRADAAAALLLLTGATLVLGGLAGLTVRRLDGGRA